MMGERMEIGAHLGIRVKLTIDFSSDAYWDGWDA
jgi:hypothetical protein